MDPGQSIPSHFGGFGPPPRFRQRKSAVEAESYDYRAARTYIKTPNTVLDSVIHMLMFPLGSGLVALHDAYRRSGIWTGVAINIILSCSSTYYICILVWTAQKMYGRVQMSRLSYSELTEAVVLLSPWPKFRKWARCCRYTLELTMALHCYGSCVAFLTMISRNLKELVEGDETVTDYGDPTLKLYTLSLMVPCMLVCMVTDLKYLAPFSLIADIYAVALILVTVWYTLKGVQVGVMDRPAYKSVKGIFECSSACIFVLETASIALPLENYMDRPKKFPTVIITTIPILTVMMITVGFFGYWHYGENCVAPITIQFPFSPFVIQLRVFICLVLYVAFSICFNVAFEIEWFYLKRNHRVAHYWIWERFYRSIHVIAITLLSYSLPRVTRMMGVVGAACTCPTIYIFPPCLELCVDWEYPGLGRCKWRLLKFLSLLIFGFILFIGGSYYNLSSLIRETMRQSKIRVVNMSVVDNSNISAEALPNDETMLYDNETFFSEIILYNNTVFFENGSFNVYE